MKKTNPPPPASCLVFFFFEKLLHKSSDRKFVSWLKATEIWGKKGKLDNWRKQGKRGGQLRREKRGWGAILPPSHLFMHSCPLQCQFIAKKTEVCVQFYFFLFSVTDSISIMKFRRSRNKELRKASDHVIIISANDLFASYPMQQSARY